MGFELEKCVKASFKKGKLASTGNIVIDDNTEIQELGQEEAYKYPGVDGVQRAKKKEKIRGKIKVRLIRLR